MYHSPDSRITCPQHTPGQLPEAIRNLYSLTHSHSCLALASSLSNMPRLDRFIETLKDIWGIREEIFSNMRTALHEAVTNAILHGNRSMTQYHVYIRVVRADSWFTFSVEDEGAGFDPSQVRNPLSTVNIEEPGGRGILIMRHLADSVHYSAKGSCVWFTFRR